MAGFTTPAEITDAELNFRTRCHAPTTQMLSVLSKHRRLALAVSVVVLLSAGLGIVVASTGEHHTPGPPAASPHAQAPEAGDGVELAGWKLSLPEKNGKGRATSIEPATTNAPWLSTAPGGGLMFWAPTTRRHHQDLRTPPHRAAKPHPLPRR